VQSTPEGESKPPSRARMIVVLAPWSTGPADQYDMYLPRCPRSPRPVRLLVGRATDTDAALAGLALGHLIVSEVRTRWAGAGR